MVAFYSIFRLFFVSFSDRNIVCQYCFTYETTIWRTYRCTELFWLCKTFL